MDNESRKGVGIVLNGGGGKGAYQVGVLKALKDNGLLDDVTGLSVASIGTVNSFLYAMDDLELMSKAWDDIDMLTLFDVDLEMLFDRKPYFSREEMLKLVSKYIDFDKLIHGKYEIYSSICRVDDYGKASEVEYRKISDYDDPEYVKKILLASTALPLIYESVEIDGNHYRDGGLCDNEPIKPLYDAGYRQFIVIGMSHGSKINTEKWPDAIFADIFPSYDLGSLLDGTLNFTDKAIKFREMLGYKDGLRAIKTKFEKNEMYIRLQPALAQNDYNEIKMQAKVDNTVRIAESRISSNIDKFNEIAKKYENF